MQKMEYQYGTRKALFGMGFMINIPAKEHNNRHHYHVYRITAGGSLICRGVKEA
jgi:hypothetical protein